RQAPRVREAHRACRRHKGPAHRSSERRVAKGTYFRLQCSPPLRGGSLKHRRGAAGYNQCCNKNSRVFSKPHSTPCKPFSELSASLTNFRHASRSFSVGG